MILFLRVSWDHAFRCLSATKDTFPSLHSSLESWAGFCRPSEHASDAAMTRNRSFPCLVVWNIFIFPYIGNHTPNWLSYFSERFKPPTSSQRAACVWKNLRIFLKVIPDFSLNHLSRFRHQTQTPRWRWKRARERKSAIVTVSVSDQLPYLNSKPHFHPMILVGETAKLPSFAYPYSPYSLSLTISLFSSPKWYRTAKDRVIAKAVSAQSGLSQQRVVGWVVGLRTIWDLGLSQGSHWIHS